MTGIVEKAKEELPTTKIEAVSWESLSETIDKSFEFWDKIDKEKLKRYYLHLFKKMMERSLIVCFQHQAYGR